MAKSKKKAVETKTTKETAWIVTEAWTLTDEAAVTTEATPDWLTTISTAEALDAKNEKENPTDVLNELLWKAEEKKEEEKEEKTLKEELKKVKENMEKLEDEIGKANWNPVFQKTAFIKTVALKTPIPMYKLPEKFRTYLQNMWFGTNVYEKDKEWLEKHGADMKIINELKQYLSEHYN